MKKLLLLLSSIMITAFLIVGCSESNNLKISMITHEYSGMGMSYLISNLEEGEYKVSIHAKEY